MSQLVYCKFFTLRILGAVFYKLTHKSHFIVLTIYYFVFVVYRRGNDVFRVFGDEPQNLRAHPLLNVITMNDFDFTKDTPNYWYYYWKQERILGGFNNNTDSYSLAMKKYQKIL